MATATRKPKRRTKARPRRKPAQSPDAVLTESGRTRKLSEAIQTIVVQRLAMYDTPQTVADAVREEFGIEITRQSIQEYDPTVGNIPAAKWVAIFNATRKKFLDDVSVVPIAQKSVRLRRLDRVSVKAERQGNHAMVIAAGEQAAKEIGEVFTNRQKLDLKADVPLGVTVEIHNAQGTDQGTDTENDK